MLFSRRNIRLFVTLLLASSSLLSLLNSCNQEEYSTPKEGTNVINGIQQTAIKKVVEDNNGMLYLATEYGLLCFDGTQYVRYTNSSYPSSISANTINDIHLDKNGELWVASQKGVDKLNSKTNDFTHYPINDYNAYTMRIFEDAQGKIYALTRTGLFLLNTQREQFSKVISFESGVDMSLASRVFIDRSGQVWILSNNYIEHYDQNFSYAGRHELGGPIRANIFDGISSLYLVYQDGIRRFDMTNCTLFDNVGRLKTIDPQSIYYISGLGTNQMIILTRNGHYCYNWLTDYLYSNIDNNLPYEVPSNLNSINSITKSSNGNVYFATNNGVVLARSVDQTTQSERRLVRFLMNEGFNNTVSNGRFIWKVLGRRVRIYDLYEEVSRETYIPEVLGSYAPQTNYSFSPVLSPDGRIFFVSGTTIWSCTIDNLGMPHFECRYTSPFSTPFSYVTIDKYGTVWLGGTSLELAYGERPAAGEREVEMKSVKIESEFPQIHVSTAITLRSGDPLFAFTDIGLVRINAESHTPHVISISGEDKQMYINNLLEDKEGNIWISTTDLGLLTYDPATGQTRKYFDRQRILEIIEDNKGRIYVKTDTTIYYYDKVKDRFNPTFIDDRQLYTEISIRTLPDGRAVLTGNNLFELLDVAQNGSNTDVHLGAIISSNGRVLTTVISSDSDRIRIRLKEKSDDITIHPAVLGLQNAMLANYHYHIEGMTEDWTPMLSASGIQLYGLKYGRNNIHIKMSSPYGSFEDRSFYFQITIRRPWWISGMALTLYILMICTLIAIIIRVIHKSNEATQAAIMARRENEMLDKVNMANMDFFANISHEFRTPLTIISGTANTLSSEIPPQTQNGRLLSIMRRNADRMLKLVSQMLDFNRLEHDTLSLGVQMADAAKQVEEITDLFYYSALQKKIDITISGTEHPQLMWLDADKLEKVIYNLLSNAIKFTPPGGSINVEVSRLDKEKALLLFDKVAEREEDSWLCVKVRDTGIGIPEDKLTAIFERFISSNQKGSSGIGLYMAHSLVELHHGFIRADNRGDEESRNGSRFTFVLPMSSHSYTEAERTPEQDTLASIDEKHTMSEYVVPEIENNVAAVGSLPTVLVIDDDYEIVYYLQSLLQHTYNVLVAFDATSGYKLIESEMPDLVISDVVMLDVDGVKLCQMVRENISICHIPIILLTAKATMNDKIKGLDSGADAYIIKPFEPALLQAQIRSLLESRNRNRQLLNQATEPIKVAGEALIGKDKRLMDKLYEVMENSLSDADLNVTQISAMLGISRTKFYYKIKALTGKTPNEFFKTYKLNRSVELIREGKYKMAVIADMVGFSSPSHFAASFKKQFGVLPSKYFESNK